MTHRIEPLFMNLFSIWLKELKSFFNMTQRVEPFLCSNMNQRIEPLRKKAQRIELFLNMTQRNEPLRKKELKELNLFWTWLKELNLFKKMTQRFVFC